MPRRKLEFPAIKRTYVIPKPEYDFLREYCKKRGLSVNAQIRKWIRENIQFLMLKETIERGE